jgi:2-dehydro-3-deoxyphosphogluconate aldolase/(4S)-4-hydroxy-2-oxoglutarate aldolase
VGDQHNEVLAQLGALGVVPVVVIEHAEDAPGIANALMEGGLPCVEITFRTTAAEEAIRRISADLPDMLVGAGTVLTVEQAQKAVRAGAKFMVAPGVDPEILEWCAAREVPITPGVATPTDVTAALGKGLRVVKFFPAEAFGGIATLEAISAAFPDVRFIPTGGINTKNLANYLSLRCVHACGGSWMLKKDLITEQRLGEITERTKEAVAIVRQVRGQRE